MTLPAELAANSLMEALLTSAFNGFEATRFTRTPVAGVLRWRGRDLFIQNSDLSERLDDPFAAAHACNRRSGPPQIDLPTNPR